MSAMALPPTTLLVHPDFGDATGVNQGDTTQFRGVKYAKLKDRFSPAELQGPDGVGLDGLKHGYVKTCKVCGPNN
jgi:hypothetical protein